MNEVKSPIDEKKIAYFAMEIGLDSKMPTYSGGLGVLAGDTIKSCADLQIPMVAVTLLYKQGYFYQRIDSDGNQTESPYDWNPEDFLTLLPSKVMVHIEGRTVNIQAWKYDVKGFTGFDVPVIFLDTDVEENSEFDRSLSHNLYGGDGWYRLAQEVILGRGGVKMLKALGYHQIRRYHMNEGHSSLLTLALLKERKKQSGPDWDLDGVRRMCVFTTHTPVPAGHDQFSYELAGKALGEYIPMDLLKDLGGSDKLNMTRLALNLSHYINGVAKQHGEISREMFPGYHVDSITNGVHSRTWVNEYFSKIYDQYIPGWANDPFSLRYALNIPREEIWKAHQESKKVLIDHINEVSKIKMEYDAMTIGFARRATSYKQADLVLYDIDRLRSIARETGAIQFIFSGKAHPQDRSGKEIIKKIASVSKQLSSEIKIVYLEDYNIDLARTIISGVDLWLNTPRKPLEASGTSGMKAAHNGVPSMSILDGWWVEGCIEGITGWAIGSIDVEKNDENENAQFIYEKLDRTIIPMFYKDRNKWIDVMRHTIAINGSFFNTHRMVQQYVSNAYL